eukprot:gene38872-62449_t
MALVVKEVEMEGLWEPRGQRRLRIVLSRLPGGGLDAFPREAVMEDEWVAGVQSGMMVTSGAATHRFSEQVVSIS